MTRRTQAVAVALVLFVAIVAVVYAMVLAEECMRSTCPPGSKPRLKRNVECVCVVVAAPPVVGDGAR